jgi:uncharacterized protein YegP (UPF0339 family)
MGSVSVEHVTVKLHSAGITGAGIRSGSERNRPVAHFEIFKDKADPPEWRFRVIADNGEPVCQSEGYTTQESAERGTVDLVGVVLRAKDSPVEVK